MDRLLTAASEPACTLRMDPGRDRDLEREAPERFTELLFFRVLDRFGAVLSITEALVEGS